MFKTFIEEIENSQKLRNLTGAWTYTTMQNEAIFYQKFTQ